jgi:sodium/potassium-transporting ATPase subunit alpha
MYLFPAILFSLVMAFFWLYIPSLQRVLLTTSVPVEFWFIPAGFGVGLMLLDEGRRFAVRRWSQGFFAKIAW